MKQKRKAISPIIATLILIVITVVAGIFLYGFVSGYIGALSSTTSTPPNVQIVPGAFSGTLPGTSGTLSVTITNAGNSPVTINPSGVLYFSNGTAAGTATLGGPSATSTILVHPGETTSQNVFLSTSSPYEIESGYSYYIKFTTTSGYTITSQAFVP